jgi:hypothetical protein
VRDYVRRLEAAMIELLQSYGIAGYGKIDAPGVYVQRAGGEAKIGALGLKVRNGCTYHGLALNVDMDLTPFAAINPCGYPGLAVDAAARLRRGGQRQRSRQRTRWNAPPESRLNHLNPFDSFDPRDSLTSFDLVLAMSAAASPPPCGAAHRP